MNGRGIFISQPARLNIRHFSLRIEPQGQEPVSVPLEDISFMVLESREVVLSTACLAACAERGCLVITCNDKHMPNGALLPFHTFYRQQETVQAQLKLTQPRQKRLWQQLVRHKIRNQASCLAYVGADPEGPRRVGCLELKVGSGDPSNVEALAARLYFKHFEKGFIRNSEGEDRLNGLLNYGYALLRAAIARNLTALGFVPCLGIHHCSQANAFNLADDIIEPWRPILDVQAMKIYRMDESARELTPEDKRRLAGIFHQPVFFEAGCCTVLQALRRHCEQLRGYYLGGGMPAFPDFWLETDESCPLME